jgi:hypothetical protein
MALSGLCARFRQAGELEPNKQQWADLPATRPPRSVVACEARASRGGKVTIPDQYLERLGLIQLRAKTRAFPWRTHDPLSESRMRENRPSGLTSVRWKRSTACDY